MGWVGNGAEVRETFWLTDYESMVWEWTLLPGIELTAWNRVERLDLNQWIPHRDAASPRKEGIPALVGQPWGRGAWLASTWG